MANVTTYKTLSIAVGDLILDSVRPGNTSGYEVITNVSASLDTTTNRYVYTITTASHTIVGDYGTIGKSSVNSAGVQTWVVGQDATSL